MVGDCLEEGLAGDGADGAPAADRAPAVFAASLLRDQRPEAPTLLGALADAWVRGAEVDWERVFDGSGARRVPLPGYAFQRERFWLSSGAGAGDLAAVGQIAARHPLLGASVRLASDGGSLLTGRLSLQTHPWLADHAVLGTVLLPGTAFVELALRAGAEVGCPLLDELVLEAPLVLGEDGGVQLQVAVGAPLESGGRAVEIYSAPDPVGGLQRGAGPEQGAGDGSDSETLWTRHASGVLGTAEDVSVAEDLAGAWPPEGAEQVNLDGLYERLGAVGFDYGPAFQGLQRVWRRGEELFAEATLLEGAGGGAHGFHLHPALLDSLFQPSFWTRPPCSYNILND